jgi:hypothetical protein
MSFTVERVDPNAMGTASPPGAWRPKRATAAFTVLEILLSIAILGLVAGVLIGGSAALLSTKPVSVDEVFWAAVQEARKDALNHDREVRLRYYSDRDRGTGFEVVDGSEVQPFPIHPSVATSDLLVDFVVPQKGGNTIMIAGVVLETAKIPHATFYPDGTCTPFRMQVGRTTGSYTVSVDPWTCAPVLHVDPNAPKI